MREGALILARLEVAAIRCGMLPNLSPCEPARWFTTVHFRWIRVAAPWIVNPVGGLHPFNILQEFLLCARDVPFGRLASLER